MEPTPEILEMLRRNSGLGLTRDGGWHIRGEAITHERILGTLDQGLEVRDDGEVIVRVGSQWAYVAVEDTAFVVRNIRPLGENEDSPAEHIELILNGGRRERLDPSTLMMKGEDALYCQIQDGRVTARFLRAAYHNLLPFLSEAEPPSSGYTLALSSGTFPITMESAPEA